MKYTADDVRTAVAGYPRISERPTQGTLWALKNFLIRGLRKINHPDHRTEGFGPYLRTANEQALVSPQPWTRPEEMGDYFDPALAAITDRQLTADNNRWTAKKNLQDTFRHFCLVLVQVFEDAIPAAYHSGSTVMGQQGFGNLEPREILFRLMHLYGKPSLDELEKALQRFHRPMDRNAPVEVMLRDMEETQMFLMANADEDRALKETQLITYALIKLAGTGLYSKAIERWSAKTINDRKVWANFRVHMVNEYERMLAEGTGPTVAQEGWGGAFNAVQEQAGEDDNVSLLESITQYAERATAAESDVSTLKSEMGELRAQMAAMMMGGLPPNQGAFFVPQGPPQAVNVPNNPHKKRKSPQAAAGAPPAPMDQARGWSQWNPQQGHQPWQSQPQWRPQQQTQQRVNPPYSNTQKEFQNLYYCFTHGYDVDHPGHLCQHAKAGHIPNIPRDEAHLCPRASMKGQHKVLPDGTGAGKGWIMLQQQNKGLYTMAQQGQEPWATLWQNAGPPQGRQGGRRPRGQNNQRRQGRYGGGQQGNQNWGS